MVAEGATAPSVAWKTADGAPTNQLREDRPEAPTNQENPVSVSTTARLGYAVLGTMRLGDDSLPRLDDAQAMLHRTTSALVQATRRSAALANEVASAQTMVDTAKMEGAL